MARRGEVKQGGDASQVQLGLLGRVRREAEVRSALRLGNTLSALVVAHHCQRLYCVCAIRCVYSHRCGACPSRSSSQSAASCTRQGWGTCTCRRYRRTSFRRGTPQSPTQIPWLVFLQLMIVAERTLRHMLREAALTLVASSMVARRFWKCILIN